MTTLRARMQGLAGMRILKWIGIAFLALVLVTGALLAWLVDTESGARFALARAVGSTEGKLAFERSSGRLAGPLTLVNVRYVDPAAGVDARVAHRGEGLAAADVRADAVAAQGEIAVDGRPHDEEAGIHRGIGAHAGHVLADDDTGSGQH